MRGPPGSRPWNRSARACADPFGGFAANIARGLKARHDHGSQYMSDHFQKEIAFLGIETYVLYTQANSNGLNWQGRYGLPIYIGLPFVVMARRPRIDRRTLHLAVIVFGVVQWISLYWALRRKRWL